MALAPALVLFAACASTPKPLPATFTVPGNDHEPARYECKTVLDCMRARGSPPGGLTWTCERGFCTEEQASHSASTE
jgi:hypothetical protein